VLRIEAAKDRSEHAAADLMQHAIVPERGRRTVAR
jgi:hypothetical protein